ncbi:MAG TPA: Chromate resistance protein ChrB [Streptosporangiaceae bacterium]
MTDTSPADSGESASTGGPSGEEPRGGAREAAGDGQGAGWLLLVYRVPSEPTRLRAAVWRRLKSLGAIYLQNSAAALPASVAAERALRRLRREILDMSGTAVLLSCAVLAGEQGVLAAFQAARDDEYEEIVDKCHDFIAEVQKEYVASHFSYAELEENEVYLVKLRNWLGRVRERDVFGAAGRAQAEQELASCEQELERFAARVYEEEAEGR